MTSAILSKTKGPEDRHPPTEGFLIRQPQDWFRITVIATSTLYYLVLLLLPVTGTYHSLPDVIIFVIILSNNSAVHLWEACGALPPHGVLLPAPLPAAQPSRESPGRWDLGVS